MQTVEIDAVEADTVGGGTIGVVQPKPFDEVEHWRVAPHPRRKALETRQGGIGIVILALPSDVSIHAIRVRPIGFDGNAREAALEDQSLGDLDPLVIELVRTMRGFADQYNFRVAHQFQNGTVIGISFINRDYDFAQISLGPITGFFTGHLGTATGEDGAGTTLSNSGPGCGVTSWAL